MSPQYLRQCSLVVADASNSGIELGDLRLSFQVHRGDLQTPNTCDVQVMNLSPATSNALRNRGTSEFTQLLLKVGYQGQPLSQIFYGSIKQVRQGRIDQKDSYIAITAADGDEIYNFAPVAFTFSKGSHAASAVQSMIAVAADAAKAMSESKIFSSTSPALTKGYIAPLDSNPSIRGRVYYGQWRDEMRELAQSMDCKWWIENGQLSVVPITSYVPIPSVLITPQTGLIGVPEQTQNGLSVRVLLNPQIKIGTTIKLQADINELRLGIDQQSVAQNTILQQGATKLNSDGLYYVMRADHYGDTRGNSWYTDLTCLAVDASGPSIFDASPAPAFPAGDIPRY